QRFHVAVRGSSDPSLLGAALSDSGSGEIDAGGENAYVTIQSIVGLSEGLVDADWQEGFSKMIDYAQSKGWVGSDGTTVKAHIEWDAGT
ncbi:MAG TPA: hypothetical protein VMU77_04680, partial [Acidimicrobiales bacterium]|nr:hypothetical protein [Acidimicrobiales bacterium]